MKRPYGYMDVTLAKHIIDDLHFQSICEKITFHVMGEPTLHPHFFEILSYAQKKGVKIGLTTNGAGLRGSTGKELVKYNLHQIDISLQTTDEDSYRLRKAGTLSFDEYVEGILGFFSNYRAGEKDTIFKFRFMNTRFCSREMSERINMMSINSSSEELYNTLRSWTEKIYDELGVNGKQRAKVLNRMRRLSPLKWNVVEIFPDVFFETYLLNTWGDPSEDCDIRDAWAGYCFGMRDHFGILYNGDVVLCCIDFNGHTTIGNLLNSLFSQLGRNYGWV
jgi:MoaA/NifB/PqqE/SkfB family radical SAM enzyme